MIWSFECNIAVLVDRPVEISIWLGWCLITRRDWYLALTMKGKVKSVYGMWRSTSLKSYVAKNSTCCKSNS